MSTTTAYFKQMISYYDNKDHFAPVPRGGHVGGRADGHWKVHRKHAEHGRAVHCDATASGPVRGGQSKGGHEGSTTVV